MFAVSRFMGSSIAMIDRHYGHLAHDSCEHAVSLLDALAFERAVDAAWTSPRTPAKAIRSPFRTFACGDHADRWTPGGRRASFLSPHQTTKGANQQELREALFRTRTGDPLLTIPTRVRRASA